MSTLKETISLQFANKIAVYEKYKNSILSNGDNVLENINIICDAIENKKNINEVFSNEQKRAIFDKGIPCKSSEMIWFVCAYKDNLDLFEWACNGLGWLKGSEKYRAILVLEDYIKEYKPQQIAQWLIGQAHEKNEANFVARNVSPYLLYAIEGKEKKLQHQLVGSNIFISNNTETYEFLRQTKDEHLFNKIMKKHFKNFKFYKDNIILKLSDEQREIKFYSHYFDESDTADKIEKIKNFREMKFDNIADYINSYSLNKTLEENLSSKDIPKKKIKI